MSFKVYDPVRVKKLNKTGEVIEVTKPGLYRVAVGTLVMACKENELLPSEKFKSKHADLPDADRAKIVSEKHSTRSLEKIDLHGMTAADAVRAFEDHLNKALLAGMDSFAVVHGHGTGRVREAVYAYIANAKVIRSHRVDDFNSGMTHIYL